MPITDPAACPARVELDQRQFAFLGELPHPAHGLENPLPCELEAGHSGAHAALGQHSLNTQWWVQWTLTASEINALAGCPAERVPGDEKEDDNVCLLYDGHPGRHFFGDHFGPAGPPAEA